MGALRGARWVSFICYELLTVGPKILLDRGKVLVKVLACQGTGQGTGQGTLAASHTASFDFVT